MNMRWSLDQLFTSFESLDFQQAIDRLNQYIEQTNLWVTENLGDYQNAGQKLEEYLRLENRLGDHLVLLSAYARLNLSVDARDQQALQILELLDNKRTELVRASVSFNRWLSGLENLKEVITTTDYLKKHQFYLLNLAKHGEYLLSEEEEIVLAQMTTTGSKSWTKLQNKLVATLLVDMFIDGEDKRLPLPVVRDLAHHPDSQIRKRAYEAELQSYTQVAESVAASLNNIKGEVLTKANLRGFSSPLEEVLLQSRMEAETLEVMLTAVKESLPVFREYYIKKAKLLGYDGGLPFYEIFAPVGGLEAQFTYQEAKDYILKNFNTFSAKLADFAEQAFFQRWIDAEPRNGKRGGAFCSNIHPIKESRILLNFTGTFKNVTTLAHELGHGYHGSCLSESTFLNSRYPMPLAETASIFAETIVTNSALADASEREALSILESSISGAGQVVVDIYSRFLFEDELFRRRKEHSLSVADLKELMCWAQKEAYGNGLDSEILHPYMWINKSHYYSAERNYYNFPYTFGLLFAKGLYVEYLKQGQAFVQVYDDLLRATGSMSIKDVTQLVGVDVNSLDFWRNSLQLIAKDIERFGQLAEKSCQ